MSKQSHSSKLDGKRDSKNISDIDFFLNTLFKNENANYLPDTSRISIENLIFSNFLKFSTFTNVPEVLNVHVNESKKKSTFFRNIFFSRSEKFTFETENVIF